MMMQNGILKCISHLPCLIFKVIFLTTCALENEHHCAKFREDWSYLCRDIMVFHVCQVKCKHSLDAQWSRLIWHHFVKVRDRPNWKRFGSLV